MSRSKRAYKRIMKEGRFTHAEMADVAGSSTSKSYEVASQNTTKNWTIEQAERVGDFFCDNNEFRFSMAFSNEACGMCQLSFGTPNGRIDDENADMTVAMGLLIEEMRSSRDPRELDRIEREIASVVSRIRSEISVVKGAIA